LDKQQRECKKPFGLKTAKESVNSVLNEIGPHMGRRMMV